MRTAKHASFLLFLLTIVIARVIPVSAGYYCAPAGCPPWGVLSNSGCGFDNVTCTDALETCNQYCDAHLGLQSFSCNAQGSGLCYCNGGFFCPECTLDPESCDPQTPFDYDTCSCQGSPTIVDMDGDGIHLTNVDGGVAFDLTADGVPEQIAWTAVGSDDGFLVLDRNGDGVISNGHEMFGSLTPQPNSDSPNGFIALAVFDGASEGGNADGWIDRRDAIFGRLRIWVDRNHDGLSQASEMQSMAEAGVRAVSLRFETVRQVDEFRNTFRYRSRVIDRIPHTRWIWDVFLSVAPLS